VKSHILSHELGWSLAIT